jgi:transcriptional regulator with XRE-family HTH domain
MTTADKIRELIEEKGLTQRQFAEIVGIHYITICNNLSKGNFSHKSIEKIADAFQLSVYDLLADEVQNKESICDVEGYIEYGGEIIKIKSYNQFKKLSERIEYEVKILPKEVKKIRETNKRNGLEIRKTKANSNYNFNINELRTVQEYDATKVDCWAFKTSKDKKDGIVIDLGNQCSGYAFDFCGYMFHTSETAYLCGQFSCNTEEHRQIQERLLAERNGFNAKKWIKNSNAHLIREDWNEFNAEWMQLVIWHKCKGNKAFADKLKSLPIDSIIIENSTTVYESTNNLWGSINTELEEARNKVQRYTELEYSRMAKKEKKKNLPSLEDMVQQARDEIQYIGTYKNGCNYMGKILKQCQLALLNGTEPPINYELLRSKQIYLLGKELTF